MRSAKQRKNVKDAFVFCTRYRCSVAGCPAQKVADEHRSSAQLKSSVPLSPATTTLKGQHNHHPPDSVRMLPSVRRDAHIALALGNGKPAEVRHNLILKSVDVGPASAAPSRKQLRNLKYYEKVPLYD